MSNSPFRVVAKDKEATIYLYDEVGLWGVSADRFVKDLNAVGDVSTITLRINSPGGDVFDGVAIYNTLKRSRATVNVEVDGYAASIASVIAMAGDSITMAENSQMMIHNPWTLAWGEAKDLRKSAELLDTIRDQIIQTYAKRTRITATTLGQMMDEETWMTPTDAMQHGFADGTFAGERVAACDMRRHFRRTPPENFVPGESSPHFPPTARASKLNDINIRIAEASL